MAVIRFSIGLAACGIAVIRRPAILRFRRIDLLATRAFVGASAALLYFVALEHLPAGTTTLLQYSSPIWSTMFAALALGEVPRRLTVIALGCASAGVALVVVGQGHAVGGGFTWLIISVGAAVLSGVAVVAVRGARRYNSAWTVFAAFSIAGVLVPLPFAVGHWHPLDATTRLLAIAVGVAALGGQMLMTYALGFVDNATAGVVSQLTVVVAMTLGACVHDEVLTALSAAGAAITVVGIALAARAGAARTRTAATTSSSPSS